MAKIKANSAKAIFDKETESMFVIITKYGDDSSCVDNVMYTYSLAIRDYNNATEFFKLQSFLNDFDLKKIVIYNVKENKRYDYCVDKLITTANIMGFDYVIKGDRKND